MINRNILSSQTGFIIHSSSSASFPILFSVITTHLVTKVGNLSPLRVLPLPPACTHQLCWCDSTSFRFLSSLVSTLVQTFVSNFSSRSRSYLIVYSFIFPIRLSSLSGEGPLSVLSLSFQVRAGSLCRWRGWTKYSGILCFSLHLHPLLRRSRILLPKLIQHNSSADAQSALKLQAFAGCKIVHYTHVSAQLTWVQQKPLPGSSG